MGRSVGISMISALIGFLLYSAYAGYLPSPSRLFFGEDVPVASALPAPVANAIVAAQTSFVDRTAALAPAAGDVSSRALVLIGTTVGNRQLALIAFDHGTANVYGIGQRVLQGLTLEAVFPGHVVLKNGNGSVSITLPMSTKARQARSDGQPWLSGNEGPVPPVARMDPPHNSSAEHSVKGSRAEYVLSRSDIRSQLSPENIESYAKFSPTDSGGLQVIELQENSVLSRLGMLPGDIVRSVNGQPLNGLDDFRAAYESLQTRELAQFEFVRARANEHWQYKVTDQ